MIIGGVGYEGLGYARVSRIFKLLASKFPFVMSPAGIVHTRESACRIDGNGEETVPGGQSVVIEQLYNGDVCSIGYIHFPPKAKKESRASEFYDVVGA